VSADQFEHRVISCQKQPDTLSSGLFMLFNLECVLLGVEPGRVFSNYEDASREVWKMIADKHPSQVTDMQEALENYRSPHKTDIEQGWHDYSETRARLNQQRNSSQILKASTPGHCSEEDNVIEIPATGSTAAQTPLSQRLSPTPESTAGKGKPLFTPDRIPPGVSRKSLGSNFVLRGHNQLKSGIPLPVESRPFTSKQLQSFVYLFLNGRLPISKQPKSSLSPTLEDRSEPSTISQPTIPISSMLPSLDPLTSHTTTSKQREISSFIQQTVLATKSSMIPLVPQKPKKQTMSHPHRLSENTCPLAQKAPSYVTHNYQSQGTGQEGNASFTFTGISSADHVFFAPPPPRHTSSKLPTIPGSFQYQPTGPTHSGGADSFSFTEAFHDINDPFTHEFSPPENLYHPSADIMRVLNIQPRETVFPLQVLLELGQSRR
jgi:hypothetical protein